VSKPKAYLIPNFLGENVSQENSFPANNRNIIDSLDVFAVEHLKEARRLFVKMDLKHKIENSRFYEIHNKANSQEQIDLLKELNQGHSIGIISDAGCPSIADPGSGLINIAHQKGYQIIPLVGPSSILMALIASGFNGQSFVFHGYLSREQRDRITTIRQMESNGKRLNQTQVFMETPYRNDALFKDLIRNLNPKTQLCIASSIMQMDESIQTKAIEDWKKTKVDLKNKPSIFLISA